MKRLQNPWTSRTTRDVKKRDTLASIVLSLASLLQSVIMFLILLWYGSWYLLSQDASKRERVLFFWWLVGYHMTPTTPKRPLGLNLVQTLTLLNLCTLHSSFLFSSFHISHLHQPSSSPSHSQIFLHQQWRPRIKEPTRSISLAPEFRVSRQHLHSWRRRPTLSKSMQPTCPPISTSTTPPPGMFISSVFTQASNWSIASFLAKWPTLHWQFIIFFCSHLFRAGAHWRSYADIADLAQQGTTSHSSHPFFWLYMIRTTRVS